MERGSEHQAAGEHLEALSCYRARLSVEPGDLDARLLLARALVAQGDEAAALAEVERCLEAAPDAPPVQLAGGLLLHLMGRYRAADRCFQRVGQLQPDDGSVAGFLGIVEMQVGRMTRARVQFERAMLLQPDALDPALNLARWLIREGRTVQALCDLEVLAERFPESDEVQLELGRTLAACGLRIASVETLRAVVEKASEGPSELRAAALRTLGELYADADSVEPAVACFEAAIMESDQPHPILDDLAQLYTRTGRHEEGLELLRLAVRMDGRTTDRLRLARDLDGLGYAEEALEQLRLAESTGACQPSLLWALGRQEEAAGHPQAARRHFRRLLLLGEQNPSLAARVDFVWMVAERSLTSEVQGVSSPARGQEFLGRLRRLVERLPAEHRFVLEKSARRRGLPAQQIVQGKVLD